MTSIPLVRIDELAAVPWANGHGSTVEILRRPAFGVPAVRLSLATVAGSVPFSRLPGIDRALMPISPGGLRLRVNGRATRIAQFQMIRFAGEDDVSSVDVVDPGRDLNLMVRRDGGVPFLRHVRVAGRIEAPSNAVAVVALGGDVTALGVRLHIGDTVVGGGAAFRGDGSLAVVELH